MTGNPITPAKQASDIARFALVALGAVALVLGVIVLAAPQGTLALITIIFGIYFIVSGVIRLAEGISLKTLTPGLRAFVAVFGVLVIVAGIYVLINPEIGAKIIGLLIGISWILEGLATMVVPGADGKRGWSIVGGALTFIAGVIVLFIPVTTVVIFTIAAGIMLVVVGIITIVHGFRLGKIVGAVEG